MAGPGPRFVLDACLDTTTSTKNLSHRPTEASGRFVTPDRRKVGLEVSSIDGVMLSDAEVRENARSAADILGHDSYDFA